MEAGKGQADERGKIPSFKTIKLEALEQTMKECHNEGKFVFIADMSGKASTFFDYQTQWEQMSFHGEVKKVII